MIDIAVMICQEFFSFMKIDDIFCRHPICGKPELTRIAPKFVCEGQRPPGDRLTISMITKALPFSFKMFLPNQLMMHMDVKRGGCQIPTHLCSGLDRIISAAEQ